MSVRKESLANEQATTPTPINTPRRLQTPLEQPQLSWWKRILPHREDLILPTGREVKGGIVIHPIIASAILGVIITLGLAMRSELNWQHDQLITITTQKDAAEKQRDKEDREAKEERDMQRIWRENLDKKMARLEMKVGGGTQ